MSLFDEATVWEIEVLQQLLKTDLAGAIAAMPSVEYMECFLWRAWVAARHNGHPDVTLDEIRQLPYLQLLEAQAADGGVTDAAT